jgi:hypothetical protein
LQRMVVSARHAPAGYDSTQAVLLGCPRRLATRTQSTRVCDSRKKICSVQKSHFESFG